MTQHLPPKCRNVELPPEMARICEAEGRQRWVSARSMGAIHKGNAPADFNKAAKVDIMGTKGEAAAAQALGLDDWYPAGHAQADLGHMLHNGVEYRLEVKTSQHITARLLLRLTADNGQPGDDPDSAYILVVSTGPDRFSVVGWQ